MADVIQKLVSVEVSMMKATQAADGSWTKGVQTDPKFVFKVMNRDGTVSRIFQNGSEAAMKFAKEQLFPNLGLEPVLQVLPLLGRKYNTWLKPSDNPQYKDSWQFCKDQNPQAAPPPTPVSEAGYMAQNPPPALNQQGDQIPF